MTVGISAFAIFGIRTYHMAGIALTMTSRRLGQRVPADIKARFAA
jgi:hypothetical protein